MVRQYTFHRLVLISVTTLIVMAAAISYSYYQFAYELLMDRAVGEIREEAQGDVYRLERHISSAHHEIEMLEKRPKIHQFFSQPGISQPIPNASLQHYIGNIEYFPHLFLISADTTDPRVIEINKIAGPVNIINTTTSRSNLPATIIQRLKQTTPLDRAIIFDDSLKNQSAPKLFILQPLKFKGEIYAYALMKILPDGLFVNDAMNRVYSGHEKYFVYGSDKVLKISFDKKDGWDVGLVSKEDNEIPIITSHNYNNRHITSHIDGYKYLSIKYSVNSAHRLNQPMSFYIAVSLEQLDQIIKKQLDKAVLIVAIIILLSLVAYLFFIKNVSRATDQILDSILSFKTGKNIPALPIKRKDEIGRLSQRLQSLFESINIHTDELEYNQGKLSALFEVIAEGIVIADQFGNIESVNDSLCSMFGYQEEELINKNVSLLMPSPYATHHDQYMSDAVTTGSMGFMGMYRSLRGLRKDKSTFPVSINVDQIRVGEKIMFAAVVRDISEQRRYEQELISAKTKAEVANEAKSNFLAMMSHEVRTPLNGVMGILQLLEHDLEEGGPKDMVHVAISSSQTLLSILNDILDISKIEVGKLELDPDCINLQEMINDCSELARLSIDASKVDYQIDLPTELPLVKGDELRLKQIINNLLNNAIKFTLSGSIKLQVMCQENKDDVQLNLSVIDTGVWISADKLESVFEPFQQADMSTSRLYGGTGLGLSIVKRLVEYMGGSIVVESVEGSGSRFDVSIPLQKISVNNEPHWLNDKHVLYLIRRDEDPVLTHYLTRYQAHIHRLLKREWQQTFDNIQYQIDLLVVDCSDDCDKTLLNKIEQLAQKGVPVIYLRPSYQTLDFETDWSLELPVSQAELQQCFHRLELGDALQHDIKRATTLENKAMHNILLVEDNQVNQMVAKSMLERMGYQVLVAENGQIAVDKMKTEEVDLVLMDCHMPVMDGFEAIRQIRDYLAGRPIPIVAMTADASTSDRESCLGAGMDDHIAKPVKIEILKSTIEQWLHNDAQ
ncbi:MAG: response regulator [Gammaproteobacteria bacterium]|nr:response regulator [Gammaproteobacteria bacterium]